MVWEAITMTNKSEWLIAFGQTIKRLRIMHGLTQGELAEKCGYNTETKKTMISAVERGKTDIPVSKVQLFASAFGMTGGELMELVSGKEVAKSCGLYDDCHGAEINKLVDKLLMLDEADRNKIAERIEVFLEADKYLKRDLVDREIS